MIRECDHLGLRFLIKKKEDKTGKKKIEDSSNEIISDDLDVANTLNEYFQNATTEGFV